MLAMAPDSPWYSIFGTPFAWISTVAGLITIAFAIGGWHVLAIVLGSAVLIAVVVNLHEYRRRLAKAKQEVAALLICTEILHDAVDDVRDDLKSEIIRQLSPDPDRIMNLIRITLQRVERCFFHITGQSCHASIMLPDDYSNPKSITTTIRSGTETSERFAHNTSLPVGIGLAGKAFSLGDRSVHHPDFTKTDLFHVDVARSDWSRFYMSGISSPFAVDGEVHGVLNVDCRATYVIGDEHKFLVQCFADFIGLMIQVRMAICGKV